MKHYYKSKTIHIPIYNIFVKITIVDSIGDYCVLKNYIGALKKEEYDGYAAIVWNLFNYKEYSYSCDLVFEKRQEKESIIAHECFHLTKMIMESKGCTLTDSSEEAWAYLNEYLYNQIREETIKMK